MVVIDATMLLLLLDPSAPAPGRHAKAKVEYLITELDRTGTRIVIPAPALAEVLVRRGPGRAHEIVTKVNEHAVFSIEPFDARAAIELAELMRGESAQDRKAAKKGGAVTHAKLKFDRQILAIAKVVGATRLYTDDEQLQQLCSRSGIKPMGLPDLPLPPEREQRGIFDED